MAAAMRAARATFPEFAREVELERWRIVPAYNAILVKAFFPLPDDATRGEFHFLDDIVISRTHVSGSLNGSSPACRLQMGQKVSVPIDAVCDWFLLPGAALHGRGVGGFTVDVLRESVAEDQRHEYESHPPVSWYCHRDGFTAKDELDAVPSCVACGHRDLIAFSYRDGKCGCCTNGLKRTVCSECTAPIIRGPGQPSTCFSCSAGRQQSSKSSSPQPLADRSGLSTQSKIYSVCVLLILALTGLILVMMIFDPAAAQAKGRTMMIAFESTLCLLLAGTLVRNYTQKRLMMISTILQIIALLGTCVGIPVAVFGIVALTNQHSSK